MTTLDRTYREIADEELITLERKAARELHGIHGELRARGHVSTDISHDLAYALAHHYVTQLMRHDSLTLGDIGAVQSWFGYLIHREIERRARQDALSTAREIAEAHLLEITSAEVRS